MAEAARIGPNHPASSSPFSTQSLDAWCRAIFLSDPSTEGRKLGYSPSKKFDPIVTIREIERLQARNIFIVGDAFALPLADALDVYPEAAASIASLRTVTSSGALFSESNKTRLLVHNPQMAIIDALGSSESSGTAIVVTTVDGSTGGGKFQALQGVRLSYLTKTYRRYSQENQALALVVSPLPLGYLGRRRKEC